ncbi:MAG: type II secretion system F family protein [Candidatus Marinimicrobia bacterium]|nr:type II secretion system F family protein [Candidatus Neomarinimicrobiota bacterium]
MNLASDISRYVKTHLLYRGGGRRKDAAEFIRKLSTLLNSGVSVNKALRMIAKAHQQDGNKNAFAFIKVLSHGIEEGHSLFEVLGIHLKQFDTMTLSLIKVGEESGQLPAVLRKIIEYLDNQSKYRKKLTRAMTYPVIVMIIATLTVVFLTYFLLPMFGEMYKDMDMELPGFTSALLSISEHGSVYLVSSIVFVLSISFGAKRLSKIPSVNQRLINVIRRTPFVGTMTTNFVTMYYTQILGTLLESGLTLLHGLEICQQISKRGIMREFFSFVIKSLKEGRSFSEVLTVTSMLDYEYVQLIQLSEESGELKPAMTQINTQVSLDLENKLENIGSILEPLIIVFVGITIGAVIIGMYLPIFEMSANMNY